MKLGNHAGGNVPDSIPMGLVQPLGVHDGLGDRWHLDRLTLSLA
jgi:hypothetical protein